MTGATVAVHETELGRWTRAHRTADPRLRPFLDRDYVGFEQRAGSATGWIASPVATVSLIVTLDGPLCADGRRLPGAWLGGLGGPCQDVALPAVHASLDLKLSLPGAYALCGRPLRTLAGQAVSLSELFGAAGHELEARLHGAGDWTERFALVEAFLLDRARDAIEPDPTVRGAWSRLCESDGAVRIAALAAEAGVSRRHLSTRFHEQLGLPPKTVARLLRFASVCRRVQAAPQLWADIAYAAGYCDQAHLNREFRELAGTSPTAFVRAARTAARQTGQGITFVQDAGADAG